MDNRDRQDNGRLKALACILLAVMMAAASVIPACAAPRTLYARWKPITYSISYELNGGALPQQAPRAYDIETSLELPVPVKDGAVFAGWTGSNGSTPETSVTIPQGSTGDRNYTANWYEGGTVLKLTYDPSRVKRVEIYKGSTLVRAYDRPGTQTAIVCEPGGKIVLRSDPDMGSSRWYYLDVNGNPKNGYSSSHDLWSTVCHIDVPSDAKGVAELYINRNSFFDQMFFQDIRQAASGQGSTGWISQAACHPRSGA